MDIILVFYFWKTFGQAIIVAGGMGVHQNNLDSVEILRIDQGAAIHEVNMYLYTTLKENN